jgi:hypothetical protein
VDIPALKRKARALEQQGSAADALTVYQQILAEVDAVGGIRQELPLLVKIGDLLSKAGDLEGAIGMYERAAGEYALQGATQPVMSLCAKILRTDPQEAGAYLRLARRLLDAGFAEGTRQLLIDYAQRGNLERTREGLETLAGRPEDELKRVLDRAIFSAERRAPKRPPQAAAPAAPPKPAPPEEPEEPEPEQASPTKDQVEEKRPQDAFPTAEDLQAPVLPTSPPETPPHATPPPPPREPPPLVLPEPLSPQPLGIDASLAPVPQDTERSPGRAESPPERSGSSEDAGTRYNEPPPERPAPPPRRLRPERRAPRGRGPVLTPPRPPARRRSSLIWIVVAAIVVVGGGAALIWSGIIPLGGRLPAVGTRAKAARGAATQKQSEPRGDTVMARDTAGFTRRDTASGIATPPAPPPLVLPKVPVTLPPGVTIARSVYVVQGLQIRSLTPDSTAGRQGYRIVQQLDSQRIVLEEFPSDSAVPGEIGVTGLAPDTVVGHVGMGGLAVVLKAVLPEGTVVQLLQQLIEIRPRLQ